MSISIKPLVLVVAALASPAAQAQLLGLGFESNVTLTQDDLDMIHRAVTQQIHGKPVATTASWSNPNSKNSGTISLLKKFTARNMRCETLGYTDDDCGGCLTRALRVKQLPTTGWNLENLVAGLLPGHEGSRAYCTALAVFVFSLISARSPAT